MTQTYTTIDKTGWDEGPWTTEPDKAQWIDQATGLDCLIVRGPSGALCGYVGVPDTHPLHGISYGGDGWEDESSPERTLEVHGGLTYSASCQDDAPEVVWLSPTVPEVVPDLFSGAAA